MGQIDKMLCDWKPKNARAQVNANEGYHFSRVEGSAKLNCDWL